MTWLAAAAARAGDHTALHSPGTKLTYAELDRRARAGAADLTTQGVRPGDRVALVLEPGPDFAVALHACLHAGAVAMPIDVATGVGRARSADADRGRGGRSPPSTHGRKAADHHHPPTIGPTTWRPWCTAPAPRPTRTRWS